MTYRYNYVAGQQIGKLIFLNRVIGEPSESPKANFRCVCGKEFICRIKNAKNEITKSCGCKKQEFNRVASTRHAPVEYHENGIKKLPILNEENIKRFWDKVAITAQGNLCWEWQATGDRYGGFRVGGAMYKANRVAYFLFYGVDPSENEVMHSCDNPKCCNPAHLSLGTHWDNMQDMAQKGRASKGRPKDKSNYYSVNNILNKSLCHG